MVLCSCRDRVYPVRGLDGQVAAIKSGQPKGCPYMVLRSCRDRVYPVRGLGVRIACTDGVHPFPGVYSCSKGRTPTRGVPTQD